MSPQNPGPVGVGSASEKISREQGTLHFTPAVAPTVAFPDQPEPWRESHHRDPLRHFLLGTRLGPYYEPRIVLHIKEGGTPDDGNASARSVTER
jgi:hypothetical protein